MFQIGFGQMFCSPRRHQDTKFSCNCSAACDVSFRTWGISRPTGERSGPR